MRDRTLRVMTAEAGSARALAPRPASPRTVSRSESRPPSGRPQRILILPSIHVPNLTSHVLAIIRRTLPVDWSARENLTSVLRETFVRVPTYTGTLSKVPGWINDGTTKGRDATTGATSTTNRKRTSGSARSDKTGNEASTSKDHPNLRFCHRGHTGRRFLPSRAAASSLIVRR